MNSTTQEIKLANLSVNTENPRFEMVANQREAIQTMIENQGDKLINLAKDIVEAGMLNPGELIYVAPQKDNKEHFDVLEGNRRITALKILSSIDSLVKKNTPFYRKLKPLSDQFKKKPITKISCIVFRNANDANKWIELRHTGENEGIGIVRWDTQEKERFEEKVSGTSSLALQFLDFLKKEKTVAEEVKSKLKKVPATSIVRLLRDKNVQKAFSFSIKEKKIVTDLQPKEIAKPFSRMALDLADKKIKVKDIYTDANRENYILNNFSKSDIPDTSKRTSTSWELISPVSGNNREIEPPKVPAKKSKPQALSTDRDTLIPKSFVIKISDNKSNKIYRELRAIDVDNCENAAAVLFRVFIELSIDAFISGNKIQGVKKMTPLREKTEKVISYLEDVLKVNDHVLTRIRTDINNKNSVLSIDAFNAYVHNRHFTPIPKDLKTQWDDVEKFIEIIWSTIK